MTAKNVTYHIVGGGIAGLACAKFVKKYDRKARTVVYEAQGRIGGRCYSYEDKDLDRKLDNATHVILGANKNAAALLGPQEWTEDCCFWNARNGSISKNYKEFKPQIIKAMCNTQAELVPPSIIRKIVWKLFPWSRRQRKIYFSKQDLSPRIINPLLAYVDELQLNRKLVKIESQFGKAAQLDFADRQIEVGADDKVILALDSKAYNRLTGGEPFDYNGIINVFYRTSQKLTLPEDASLMGIADGLADWIFINDDIVNVTISDSGQKNDDLDGLARKIWKQLDKLRGVNSGFVPPFKVINHKIATIRQDAANNNKRPKNAKTVYPNVFIAGDWTMKNYPCSLETAILSAKRAVKTARKS